jgi:hypothetical protein
MGSRKFGIYLPTGGAEITFDSASEAAEAFAEKITRLAVAPSPHVLDRDSAIDCRCPPAHRMLDSAHEAAGTYERHGFRPGFLRRPR